MKTSTRRGSDSGGDGGSAATAEAIIPRQDPVAAAAPRRVDLDLGGAGRGGGLRWFGSGSGGVGEKGTQVEEGREMLVVPVVVNLRWELPSDRSVSCQ